MAILVISSPTRMEAWNAEIPAALPDEDVRVWPDYGADEDIEIVIIAEPKPGLFEKLPDLKLVIAQRAGVEDLVAALRGLPDVSLCRAQGPDGDRMLDDYALLCVMHHHRHFPDLIAANATGDWINPGVSFTHERTVGLMGLGIIGLSVARRLRDSGFKVITWTRSGSDEPGMVHFTGPDQFGDFLGQSEILVNLLALTAETENILNAETFAQLPEGAALVNLGRGEHVVDDDLIAALDSGHLNAATLDVFRQEPLPAEHPFWAHPRVLVMPHIARRPSPDFLTPQLIENIRRFRAGEPLLQPVDIGRGY